MPLTYSGLAFVDNSGRVLLNTPPLQQDLNARVLHLAQELTGTEPPGYLQVDISIDLRLPPERVRAANQPRRLKIETDPERQAEIDAEIERARERLQP